MTDLIAYFHCGLGNPCLEKGVLLSLDRWQMKNPQLFTVSRALFNELLLFHYEHLAFIPEAWRHCKALTDSFGWKQKRNLAMVTFLMDYKVGSHHFGTQGISIIIIQ